MSYAGRLCTDGYTEARSPVDGRPWTMADAEAARRMADRATDPYEAASLARHAAIIAERVSE